MVSDDIRLCTEPVRLMNRVWEGRTCDDHAHLVDALSVMADEDGGRTVDGQLRLRVQVAQLSLQALHQQNVLFKLSTLLIQDKRATSSKQALRWLQPQDIASVSMQAETWLVQAWGWHLHLCRGVARSAGREFLKSAVPAAWLAQVGVRDRQRRQGFNVRLQKAGPPGQRRSGQSLIQRTPGPRQA